MKKRINFLIILFLVFFAYGLIISQFEVKIIVDELQPKNPEGYFDYKGVINIHSDLSTGSGSPQKIIRDAQEMGLNFISLTDLNLKSKPKHLEGYHSKLLVFIDDEYSYLNSRVLNLFSGKKKNYYGPGRRQVFLSDQLDNPQREASSGIFVLAHPFQRGYEWSGEYPAGLNGIEVFNLKSIWENYWLYSKASFFWTAFVYPFNPEFAFTRLFEFPDREVSLWDKLNQNHRVLGFAGTDAEEKIPLPNNKFLKIPTYKTMFKIVSNHVLLNSELTGDSELDSQRLSEALRKGNFYFSLDLLANPKGFVAYVVDPDGKQHLMGESISYTSGQILYIKLPQKPMVPFDVNIYRNGEKVLTSNSQETKYNIHAPGTYRVYVRVIPTLPPPDGKKWISWIFTNPFYLK